MGTTLKTTNSLVARNIPLMYFYILFFFTLFFLPILQLFFQDFGLNLKQIAIIGVVSAAAKVLWEIPSGLLADRWGRNKVLILVPVGLLLAEIVLVFADSFIMYIVAGLFIGTSVAFFSGSGNALLYDSLQDLRREKEFKKTLGKAYLFASISGAVSASLAGYLYELRPTLPFELSIITAIATLIVAFFLVEPSNRLQDQHSLKKFVKNSFQYIMKKKMLMFIVCYASFIAFVFQYLFLYGQVFMRDAQIGLTLIGVIYGVRLLVEGIGSLLADKLHKLIGELYAFTGILLASAVLLAVWVWQPSWLVLFILLYFVFGINRVFVYGFIHDRVNSHNRATVESIISFLMGLTLIVFEPILNSIADATSIGTALFIVVIGLFAAGLATGIVGRRLFLRHHSRALE